MSIQIHTTCFSQFVWDVQHVTDKIISTHSIIDSIQKQGRKLTLKMKVSLLSALQLNLVALERLKILGDEWNTMQPSPVQSQTIRDINAIVSKANLIGADTIKLLRRSLNTFHNQMEITFDKPRIYLAVNN